MAGAIAKSRAVAGIGEGIGNLTHIGCKFLAAKNVTVDDEVYGLIRGVLTFEPQRTR